MHKNKAILYVADYLDTSARAVQSAKWPAIERIGFGLAFSKTAE
jgi:hypothetical protein